MKKIIHHWKIIYMVCSLVYMGWIINVGAIEFDRINSQYRRIVAQLDADLIRSSAVEELTAECIRALKPRTLPEQDECYSWLPAEVDARAWEIEERLLQARERGVIKVVLFYTGFVIFFFLGPPLFIYLLLIGAIRIYKSVRFVRKEDGLQE